MWDIVFDVYEDDVGERARGVYVWVAMKDFSEKWGFISIAIVILTNNQTYSSPPACSTNLASPLWGHSSNHRPSCSRRRRSFFGVRSSNVSKNTMALMIKATLPKYYC